MGTEAKKLQAIYTREKRGVDLAAQALLRNPLLLPAVPTTASFPDSKKAFLKNIQLYTPRPSFFINGPDIMRSSTNRWRGFAINCERV